MPSLPSLATACEASILRHIIADHGPEKVMLCMRLALAQTMDVMTVVQPPDMKWQDIFVQDFLAKYDTETLDDFALFLQMFRRGELGEPGKPQLYGGRVDGVVMFECWERYADRKAAAREGMHETRKADAFRQISEAVNKSPQMQALAKQLNAEGLERQKARTAEQILKAEQHKQEGVLRIEKAQTVEEVLSIMVGHPYQSVRNMARLRLKDLGVDEETIDQHIPAA